MQTEERAPSSFEARWMLGLGFGVLLGAWLATQVDPKWIVPMSMGCIILGLAHWLRNQGMWT